MNTRKCLSFFICSALRYTSLHKTYLDYNLQLTKSMCFIIRQGQDVQLPIHAFNRTVALEIRFQRVLLTSLIRHSVWRRSTSTESASQRPKGSRLQQPSLQILNLKQFLTFLLITDWRYCRRRSLLLFTKKNQA